jgi:HEAT repeat protein
VRQRPVWPENQRFLILSGESGQGKTWQISRLAVDWAAQEKGPLVILLESRGEAERDLQKASDLLYMEAIGHDRSIPLERLAARWREIHGETDQPWLVICVDGVQGVREAQALIKDFDWGHWGIHLAMSVPTDVGTALVGERQVHMLVMRNFTLSELRAYLRRNGYAWEAVPHDVRDTLRQPLLARLYTTIGSGPEWEHTREYDLYERYWRRLQEVREQSEHPEDFVRLKRLALTLLDTEPHYPWTWEQLENAGVTGEVRLRLERAGWWIRNDEGVEVWHDRLLSWAVAEAIAERGSGEVLAARLITCLNSNIPKIRRILGYVPMDVLWLLSDHPARQGLVPGLITRLEQDDAFGYWDLYGKLLPTLGHRVVPGLLQRLRNAPTDASFHFVQQVVKTLSSILAEDGSVRDILPGLLEEDGNVREAAVELLAHYPSPTAIEPLWEIHKKNSLALEESDELKNYMARKHSFSALRACLDLSPDWLRSKIREADPNADPNWELAYLLANLKHPSARSIWMEVKGELFRKVPPEKLRSLVTCIRIFDDHGEVPRLESWLSIETDWIGDHAFRAIAWVEPDRAIALLPDLRLKNLSNSHAGSWPVGLLGRQPDGTRKALRERMVSAGSDFWKVADLYNWYEEQIDRETLGLLLDQLASDVANLSGQPEEAWNPLWRPLRLLSQIHRLDLLHVFEKRAGTDLDRRLGELGAAWIDSPGQHDLEELRLVLLKIGGEGFRHLVRAGLASKDSSRRREALAWGMAYPTELAATAPREAWVLASLGEDRAVVEEVLAWKGEIDKRWLTNLWRLRRWKQPMNDSDIALALEALASGDVKRRLRGLSVVSISGRVDLLACLPEWLGGAEELETTDLRRLDDLAGFLIHRLAQDNPAGVQRIAQTLDPGHFPGTFVELLGKPGAEDLPERLERHLLAGLDCFGEVGMELALSLRRFKELDASVLQAVWNHGKDDHGWNREVFWATVARLDIEEVHEEVWKISLDRDFMDERREGIAALRLIDLDAAFETAARHLSGSGKERTEFVWLLMDLDANRAVPLLIEQAAREPQTEILWAIARALRQAEPEVETELRARLGSSDFRVRTSAAHLAGWQRSGFLRAELQRLAESDPDRDVQWECLWALNRQYREYCVIELMDAFHSVEGITRWSYLEAILELGDPRLLVTEKDSLWLGRILTPELGSLEVHANSRLQQRFNEIKRKAEQRDRDSED